MPTQFRDAQGNTLHGDKSQAMNRSCAVEDPEHARKLLAQELGDLIGTRGDLPGGAGKGNRNPAINADEKSDASVVPKKPPNKGQPAEVVEGRGAAKGNADEAPAYRTPSRKRASRGIEGIREAARRDKRVRFTALLHHITPELLTQSYQALRRDAAVGVDGVTWEQYGEGLAQRVLELHRKVHTGAYRAQPSRRVHIPKADGKLRALGIAALEDKVVQQAVVTVLEAIYEEDFMGFSYGYRRGRGQHDALDAVWMGIDRHKVEWIVDADIAAFFDTLDHGWMMKFLEHRVADRRVLRLIAKWLKAGVLEDGRRVASEKGTPQGAVISPLLANVYLHYVFDLWAHQWRRRNAGGAVIMVRYADDSVLGFEHENEAKMFLAAMHERLAKFGLALHAQKTRLIEFGRHAAERRQQRGQGNPETFDFLGFTHCCGSTRSGRFSVRRLTAKKRMRATLAGFKDKLKRKRHEPLRDVGVWLGRTLQAYFNYHAVPGNLRRLNGMRWQLGRIWFRSLRRRSQRAWLNWQRFRRLANTYLPACRLIHPYPSQRFGVNHPRQEPYAVIPHVRIRAGGGG